MSLIPSRFECQTCFGYTDYPGHGARKSELRKHTACVCEEAAERADLEPKELPDGRFQVAA